MVPRRPATSVAVRNGRCQKEESNVTPEMNTQVFADKLFPGDTRHHGDV
jgi:hypothetical protein